MKTSCEYRLVSGSVLTTSHTHVFGVFVVTTRVRQAAWVRLLAVLGPEGCQPAYPRAHANVMIGFREHICQTPIRGVGQELALRSRRFFQSSVEKTSVWEAPIASIHWLSVGIKNSCRVVGSEG